MHEERLSFQSLDALRFVAFFKVFLLHLAAFEPDPSIRQWIFIGGDIGVNFFFVLSGFLISYLLTFEKFNTGRIHGRNYFLRRSLRIWPLFYLGIIIGYSNNLITSAWGLGSQQGYTPNIFFSIAFLENYQMIFHGAAPNGAPLRVFWSLCVEEHFYFIWFLLFQFIPLKNIGKVLVLLWALGIAYRIMFHAWFPTAKYYDIDVISRLDYFCAGSLVGLWAGMDFARLKVIASKIPLVWRTIATIAVSLFFFFHQLVFAGRVNEIYLPILASVLFAMLIWIVVTSTTFIKFSGRHLLSRLGRISYGLYVYHTVVIVLVFAVLHRAGLSLANPAGRYTLYMACLLITVVISALSYRYFEKPFLNLKKKYMA